VPSPIDSFRRLTQVFDPIYRPVQGRQVGSGMPYVEAVHQDLRKQFEAQLLLNDRAKLLLAGQPGCGKTTMLMHLTSQMRAEGRLVAFVDLEVVTTVNDLGSAEMYIAASAELLREAGRMEISLPQETVQRCKQWVESLTDGSFISPEPVALADRFTRLLAAARESPDLRRMLREVLKGQDPAELLATLLDDLESYRPVVLLDGLDKLPPDQARDFFLDQKKKPMAELPGAAILTIPLSMVYEPTFNVLSERYNNADNSVLPAVRLYDFNHKEHTRAPLKSGFELLRHVIGRRVQGIDSGLILPDAIDRAIEGSGGNIRELGRLIQSSIVKAVVRQGSFVERVDVENAIIDQRESFRRAYQPRFLPVLKKVRDQLQLDNTDDVGKLLLYGLWVMEYRNGMAWYCLPVPVEQLLQQLERG
jgi:energy-coupling factor transporter ATP-binding protein EcfA2